VFGVVLVVFGQMGVGCAHECTENRDLWQATRCYSQSLRDAAVLCDALNVRAARFVALGGRATSTFLCCSGSRNPTTWRDSLGVGRAALP